MWANVCRRGVLDAAKRPGDPASQASGSGPESCATSPSRALDRPWLVKNLNLRAGPSQAAG